MSILSIDMLARQYILPCCYEVHSVGLYVRLSVRHTVDPSLD